MGKIDIFWVDFFQRRFTNLQKANIYMKKGSVSLIFKEMQNHNEISSLHIC